METAERGGGHREEGRGRACASSPASGSHPRPAQQDREAQNTALSRQTVSRARQYLALRPN
eukprot:1266192-Prymnesium_polylepis.2